MKTPFHSTHARGFSLLEVLIAVLVISTGMLGFAATQAVSINNTAIARYQSLAAIQVSSLTSLIAANPEYWRTVTNPATLCVGIAGGVAVIDQLSTQAPCPTPVSGSGTLNSQSQSCLGSVCTAAQAAAFDLKRWITGINGQGGFIQPAASLTCSSSGGPVSCLVTLTWFEKNTSLLNPTGTEIGNLASGQVVSDSYSQVIEP